MTYIVKSLTDTVLTFENGETVEISTIFTAAPGPEDIRSEYEKKGKGLNAGELERFALRKYGTSPDLLPDKGAGWTLIYLVAKDVHYKHVICRPEIIPSLQATARKNSKRVWEEVQQAAQAEAHKNLQEFLHYFKAATGLSATSYDEAYELAAKKKLDCYRSEISYDYGGRRVEKDDRVVTVYLKEYLLGYSRERQIRAYDAD